MPEPVSIGDLKIVGGDDGRSLGDPGDHVEVSVSGPVSLDSPSKVVSSESGEDVFGGGEEAVDEIVTKVVLMSVEVGPGEEDGVGRGLVEGHREGVEKSGGVGMSDDLSVVGLLEMAWVGLRTDERDGTDQSWMVRVVHPWRDNEE